MHKKLTKNLIDLIEQSEGEELQNLINILAAIQEQFDEYHEDLGFELLEWATLKLDSPEMYSGYRAGIIAMYNELK